MFGSQAKIFTLMREFREKVHFEVYNQDKPDKYGVKSYQLNDSCNGFCCRIEIYTSRAVGVGGPGGAHAPTLFWQKFK